MLGDHIYLVCGSGMGRNLNSLERLDASLIESGTARWQLIEIADAELRPRCSAAVVAVNANEFVILGGMNFGYRNDAAVFDARQMKFKAQRQLEGPSRFACRSNACFVYNSRIVLMATDEKEQLSICTYSKGDAKLNVLQKLA